MSNYLLVRNPHNYLLVEVGMANKDIIAFFHFIDLKISLDVLRPL
jgi:hypothetical protein